MSTTRAVLEKYRERDNFKVEQKNIFTIDKEQLPAFDIVYSWGVLHHTGDMWDAIVKASALAKDNGLFAIAISVKRHCANSGSVKRSSIPTPAV
ncbi:MAG: class I SAM-dependent methyltransferase [Gammaproteobacteria bacterium]